MMESYYIISLQMIKYLCIEDEKQYNELVKTDDKILSAESLKYITQLRDFNKIIKLAEEVWEGFFYFCIRKWHFSTIVDKKYVISKIGHTKDKGGKAWE